jgi:uncharacterized protein YbbC (DUF1343 family)
MRIGLEAICRDPAAVRGRRIGLLTNPTGVTAEWTPTAVALAAAGARVAALFGPEHGLHGAVQDAVGLDDAVEDVQGVGPTPVFSLYRGDEDTAPPPAALAGLDLLVVDLQDVGARFYTYLTTLGLLLEAAAPVGLPVLVLDRPNPIGGAVEGPGLDPACRSFVGRYDLPVRHGLTLGEAARYINATALGGQVDVAVAAMEGWTRSTLWPATGRSWIPPSPNIPTWETTILYPGTCLVEGVTLSEGRGTTRPFEMLGAPWVGPERFAGALNARDLPGVHFRPCRFVPTFAKYAGEVCGGVHVHVTDPAAVRAVALGLAVIETAMALYPDDMAWLPAPREGAPAPFDRLIGSPTIAAAIAAGAPLDALVAGWAETQAAFAARCAPLLLYGA